MLNDAAKFWKNVDPKVYVHPIDEIDVTGGPKPTNTYYPKSESTKEVSEETKEKLRRKRAEQQVRRVGQYTRDTNELVREWDSCAEAAAFFKCDPATIRAVAGGFRTFALGWRWKYLDKAYCGQPVLQYLNGRLYAEYRSANQAEKMTGIRGYLIRQACEKHTEFKGYTWEYKPED